MIQIGYNLTLQI